MPGVRCRVRYSGMVFSGLPGRAMVGAIGIRKRLSLGDEMIKQAPTCTSTCAGPTRTWAGPTFTWAGPTR